MSSSCGAQRGAKPQGSSKSKTKSSANGKGKGQGNRRKRIKITRVQEGRTEKTGRG